MNFLQIFILGLVQGAAELLPVSSSAHVIIAEKLMRLDPSSPDMTFLLVMLHTGTMFAVIVYFWKSWIKNYFSSSASLMNTAVNIAIATVVTGVLGFGLKMVIEKIFLRGGEVEMLFSNLWLMAGALVAGGLLIIYAGMAEEKKAGVGDVNPVKACIIGLVQGLCLPFRGFSRSGGTISTGLLLGVNKRTMEEFSFALAVVLTPAVILLEAHRLIKAHPEMTHISEIAKIALPGFFGMICSFASGLLALWLLSQWLEQGRWKLFGYYCLMTSVTVTALAYFWF